jgi:FPC/CPF motif-containing protein YcgG
MDRLVARRALPAWARDAYLEFRDRVLQPDFPCTFGTVAMHRGDVSFALLRPTDESAERALVRNVLIQYVDRLRPLGPAAASLRPLAVLMPAIPSLSLRGYFDRGWRTLRWLASHDTHDWPDRVPTDPDHPEWSFCFGGVPLFVNFKTPAHVVRLSRRLRFSHALLFQARDGFDAIAGDTPAGRRARALIREKLETYDQIPVDQALAYYGTAENREWRQYFLPDGEAKLPERCPWRAVGSPI